MSDELAEIQRSLGRVEAHLETLVGNGKPGVIKDMQDDIDELKSSRDNAKGWAAGFGAAVLLVEGTAHYIINKFGGK